MSIRNTGPETLSAATFPSGPRIGGPIERPSTWLSSAHPCGRTLWISALTADFVVGV